MPKETVQYPKTDNDTGSEVSIHWSKDRYVQLFAQRHVWSGPTDPGDTSETKLGHPATPPLPLGTIRAAEDNSQIAYKIHHALPASERCSSSPDIWTVVRNTGSIEKCSGEQIAEWPIVHYPFDSGFVLDEKVWSDTLTRTEINRMIKILRRARDDVFGADA